MDRWAVMVKPVAAVTWSASSTMKNSKLARAAFFVTPSGRLSVLALIAVVSE